VNGGGANTLTGGSAVDSITGGTGADTIRGGDGADSLLGGGGDDTVVYAGPGDLDAGEVINGGANTDQVRLDATGTYDFTTVTITAVERIAVNANAAMPPGRRSLRR
jgi:Ca2+-binding RTX toxin-like protein